MSKFSDDRWVRIMCDWCADGVWHKSGSAGCADDLPVSAELIGRIRAWQAWYETQDPFLDRDPNFDVEAFTTEGLLIAVAVKATLPDWTVIYFDEAALDSILGMRPHRCSHEYEIIPH